MTIPTKIQVPKLQSSHVLILFKSKSSRKNSPLQIKYSPKKKKSWPHEAAENICRMMIRLKENKSWRTELPGIKLKILPSPIAGGCHMRQDHTGGKAGAFGRSNKRTVAIHRKNSIQSFSSLSWENKSFIHTRKKKRKQRQESNNRHRIHPAKKSRRRRRPARRSISTSPAHRPAPDTLPHGESRTPSPDVADPVCQPSREPNRRGLAGRGEYPGGGGGGADLGFAGRKKKKLFFSSQGGEYDADAKDRKIRCGDRLLRFIASHKGVMHRCTRCTESMRVGRVGSGDAVHEPGVRHKTAINLTGESNVCRQPRL